MKLLIKRYWPHVWITFWIGVFFLMAIQPNVFDFGLSLILPLLAVFYGSITLHHYKSMSDISGRRYPHE